MNEFVHLHTHSEYSLLDGAARVRGIVERACALGMPAVAVTDHGVLYGAMEFSKRARQAGITPIVGCEVYVAPRHRMDRTPRVDDAQYHLTLLCQDREGYHNLTRLVSRAFLEGFYYKPRVDRELLQEHHRGLVALSGCIAGEIPGLLLAGKYEQARQVAGFYREVFDGGRFYLELQDHGLEEQKTVNRELCRLSRELGIPVVASNDVHYLEREDAFIHDVLLCIQTGRLLADENRLRFPVPEFYFKSGEEMAALFAELPQALRNTLAIAERCVLDLGGGEMYLPDFPLPAGETAESYLEKLAWSRLPERMPGAGEREKARLRHELDVITRMGFAAYFLIVQDLVSWARRHDIPVGPGRGSAAGSLVAYVLGITDLDPLRYGL
ncbi:MAG: DNA polymerase III subunit alpha, partial [Syntrophomonadaceae bacterium]|nr:DNA polymerase III subunit alpha [Syntrophomonadaceae bacterium]